VPGDRYSVGLRLRAAHSGEVVYWMNNAYAQVPLPDTGPFELQFDLQVNLLPGVYTLETFIWSDTRDAQVIAGPNAHVHVTPAAHSFRGSIQLNARVTSRTPDRPAAAAAAGQREPAAIAAATAGE
jgi:hypothetical protein